MNQRHLPPSALEDWLAGVSEMYGLGTDVDPSTDIAAVLDVARDVARGVARPAAPLTTFLLGLAVGRAVPSGPVATELAALARQVQDVATGVPAQDAADAGPRSTPDPTPATTGPTDPPTPGVKP